MPDFEGWAVFARVAEFGSFATAAKALGISPATASKAVSRLEERLGAKLIHRTTRSLSLTPMGQRLVARASALLGDAEEAEDLGRNDASQPRGLVRIAAPVTFGVTHVAPLLPELHRALPDVILDLQLDDAQTDLVAQGFDIAIRIGWPRDSSLRARRLCDIRSPVVCSPGYVAAHGAPREPPDLTRHACLAYSHVPPLDRWHLVNGSGNEMRVPIRAILMTNNGDLMLPMLCAGHGIAVMPEWAIRSELRDGRLIELLPGWGQPLAGLFLVTPSAGPRASRVSAVLDFLAIALAKSASTSG